MTIVRFTKFADSTAEEWKLIGDKFTVYEHGLVDRLLASLERLKGGDLGYPVDRYEHSLQTATRAMRAGADEETIVCGLFHDIGDDLAPVNHGALAAEILRPYVSPLNYWMVRNHEPFQGYYYNHFFGGMLAASAVGIFLIPMLYVVFQYTREWVKARIGRGQHEAHRPVASPEEDEEEV